VNECIKGASIHGFTKAVAQMASGEAPRVTLQGVQPDQFTLRIGGD
jgi:hypothetical protein